MKNIKVPIGINLIYWFLNIVLFQFIILCFLILVWNIVIQFDSKGNNMQLAIGFPTKIDIQEKGTLELKNRDYEVQMVNASSRIRIFNTPKSISKVMFFTMFIVSGFMLYLTWLFRSFIVNVKKGIIFNNKNILIFQKIAALIMFFWLFLKTYLWFVYRFIGKNTEFEGIIISDSIPMYLWLPLISVVIWITAYVFKAGLKIKEENELTI